MYEISQMDNTLGFVVWGTELFKIDPFISHGLVTSKLASKIWLIISSGDSLAPDDTKPLPEVMLTCPRWKSPKFQPFCLEAKELQISFCLWAQPMRVGVTYSKISTISRTLVGNEIVDNSDVVGTSPVGAAPTTSSFST